MVFTFQLPTHALYFSTNLPLREQWKPAQRPTSLQKLSHGEQHYSSKCLEGTKGSVLKKEEEEIQTHSRALVLDYNWSSKPLTANSRMSLN